jgi:hypothetical protein
MPFKQGNVLRIPRVNIDGGFDKEGKQNCRI